MKHKTVITMTAAAGLATSRRPIGAPEGRMVVLRDGSAVLIRQVRSVDAPLLADGFARLSAASRQMRFLGVKKELSAAELRYLTDVDHHDHEALAALDQAGGHGVGIARYIRDADDPQASMTGKAGDWARSCWLSCPAAPAKKASAVSPPWPTPVTWLWPLCSAMPAPALSVAGEAPSTTRSRWPGGWKAARHAYRGRRGRRRRGLFRRPARPGRSGCVPYRAARTCNLCRARA
jgi:hypothetical protein